MVPPAAQRVDAALPVSKSVTATSTPETEDKARRAAARSDPVPVASMGRVERRRPACSVGEWAWAVGCGRRNAARARTVLAAEGEGECATGSVTDQDLDLGAAGGQRVIAHWAHPPGAVVARVLRVARAAEDAVRVPGLGHPR